jgi:hypothetical protein
VKRRLLYAWLFGWGFVIAIFVLGNLNWITERDGENVLWPAIMLADLLHVPGHDPFGLLMLVIIATVIYGAAIFPFFQLVHYLIGLSKG